MCPRPCSCAPREPTRAERVAGIAKKYLSILRQARQGQKPDPTKELIIERTRQRLNQIHSVGQRYLPQAPISNSTDVLRIRRSDDAPAS